MFEVKYITYTQCYGDSWEDGIELVEDETYTEEYGTYEEAEIAAEDNSYGVLGQFVQVFINDELVREYDLD